MIHKAPPASRRHQADNEKEALLPPAPPVKCTPTIEASAEVTPTTDANNDSPSPKTENKHLKTTISALKQQEMAMFFKLEDKVRDLDAARAKLMQLKKLSQKQESDKLLERLRGRYGDSDAEEEEEEEGWETKLPLR